MAEARIESTRGVLGHRIRALANTARLPYVRSTLIGLHAAVAGVPPLMSPRVWRAQERKRMALREPDTTSQPGPGLPGRRRGWLVAGLAIGLVLVLAGAGFLLANRSEPTPASTPNLGSGRPPRPATSARRLPEFAFGFYSAGFRPSSCYGSCKPGSSGAGDEERTRKRIGELRKMHANFVLNNTPITKLFSSSPQAVLAFLDDLHRQGIGVAYTAVPRQRWLGGRRNGVFSTEGAEAALKATDLNGDGVSDLDGRIDAVFQAHEVLEWANHDERVRMYQVTKKWFPTTPVSVYYAGLIQRPVSSQFKNRPHRRGGTWGDFAYGPGETDIVHLSAPRPFDGTTFNPNRTTERLRADVEIVRRATPDVPIYVSTSFAYDNKMRKDPASMWKPEEIQGWFEAVRSVEGVRGVFLRSYKRFVYDLGNERFGAQRAEWGRLGSLVTPSP
jgi:hypothetical protein